MRRFARRPLLVTSSLCVALGMVLLGWSTHHNTTQVLYCTLLYFTRVQKSPHKFMLTSYKYEVFC